MPLPTNKGCLLNTMKNTDQKMSEVKYGKLSKKFLYSLPTGAIILSNIFLPNGFLSWEVRDDHDKVWEDIKMCGADQRLAYIYDNKEALDAEVQKRWELVRKYYS